MKRTKGLMLASVILFVGLFAGANMLAAQNSLEKQNPHSLNSPQSQNWNAKITRTDGGHLIGNPLAKTRLTEFVSYTCPHCGHFALQGDPALKLVYIPSGKVAVEVRHMLRDPVDLTAALLTNCGKPAKFERNHAAFMLSQKKWLPKLASASEAQMRRWNMRDRAAARRAIASDMGFYAIMEQRGYGVVEVDRCLADNAKAKALIQAATKDAQTLHIKGTPSFAINGKLLDNVYSWQALQPALDADVSAQSPV